MKKVFNVIAVVLSALIISSCNQHRSEEINLDSEKSTYVYSEADEEVYSLLRTIYTEAFDGNNIDVEKFESIAVESGYVSSNDFINLTSIELRSSNGEDIDVRELLTPDMTSIYELMIELIENDGELNQKEIDSLMKKAESLSQEERADMEAIIQATHLTLSSLKRLEMENPNLRAWSFGGFVCNLASGGIGATWGTIGAGVAMALGATSTVVTGGVSLVVGAVVSAAISTVAC